MTHYCTYFDRNFLVRGLTLYRSLCEHAPPFTLWVLCLDDFTYDTLSRVALKEIRPIRLAELEEAFPELLTAKQNRTRIEYYFTCSPALPLYALKQEPGISAITYLDADLFFFSSPAPLDSDSSILIAAHNFPPALKHLEIYGRFNVGILRFRNDAIARECLETWRAQCLAWCYDRLEGDKFADQKYLDAWPARFHAEVIQHRGANVAPWNVGASVLERIDGAVFVDGQPLIFYHFHRLKLFNRWMSDPGLSGFQSKPASYALKEWIYRPYIQALSKSARTFGLDPGYVRPHAGRYTYLNLIGDAARSLLHRQLVVSRPAPQ